MNSTTPVTTTTTTTQPQKQKPSQHICLATSIQNLPCKHSYSAASNHKHWFAISSHHLLAMIEPHLCNQKFSTTSIQPPQFKNRSSTTTAQAPFCSVAVGQEFGKKCACLALLFSVVVWVCESIHGCVCVWHV